MQSGTMILGALAAAICGGAALGASVPTTPVTRYDDTFAAVPHHAPQTVDPEEFKRMIASRDQYPLETPSGVIPVEDLAFHGRLRSRLREQPLYGARSEAEAFGMESEYRSVVQASVQSAPAAAGKNAGAQPQMAQAMPANFVPLEDGIFENTDTARPARPASAADRSQPVRIAQGQAGVVRVTYGSGGNN